MLKMYSKLMFFAVTVMQFSAVVIASDNEAEISKVVTIIPKLDLLDIRPSIHYSHVMYDVNRRESEADAEKFRLFMSALLLGDHREDRMLKEQEKKNRLSIMIPSDSFARVEELDSQDSFESVCQDIDTTVPFSQFEHANRSSMQQDYCPGVRPKVTRNRFFSDFIDVKESFAGYESDPGDSQKNHIKRCCNKEKEEELLSSSIFLEPLQGEEYSESNLSVFTGLLSDDDDKISDHLSETIFNVSPASTIINDQDDSQDDL